MNEKELSLRRQLAGKVAQNAALAAENARLREALLEIRNMAENWRDWQATLDSIQTMAREASEA